MLIAHYVGDHRQDDLWTRLGWAAVRLAQKGKFDRVTHTEAVLDVRGNGAFTIGSATLRHEDGRNGVRVKHAVLQPGHWILVDVPAFDRIAAAAWFAAHDGEGYDIRGALATVLPGRGSDGRWYCTEAVAASVGFATPEAWLPCEWAAITHSIGRDVTAEFFRA